MTLKEVAQQVADELTRKQLSDNAPMTGAQLYLYAPHLVELGQKLRAAIQAECPHDLQVANKEQTYCVDCDAVLAVTPSVPLQE